MATDTTATVTNATTYNPTPEDTARIESIFGQLRTWGDVGDKEASENMLLAGAKALINRANTQAHKYKQYNRCMDYDGLVSDLMVVKTKNQASIQVKK